MTPALAAYMLWASFLTSWCLAMLWTGRATSRGGRGARIGYFLGFALGFVLLFATSAQRAQGIWRGGAGLWLGAGWTTAWWHDPPVIGWALIAAEGAAFLFAWWARLHLGKLWSGMMTLREGHRVIDTGPYRLVRHPIYAGLIGASWAMALVVATPAAIGGAIVLAVVMTIKAGGEERLLRRELGAAGYDAYAARTPMLVPFAGR